MSVTLESFERRALSTLAGGLADSCGLYGRKQAILDLLESLERIKNGGGEVCLLPGVSGVGKTALARALAGPVRSQNGFFLEGKFNQYDQNMPYVAWRQALAELCQTILLEEDVQQRKWREAIQEAVGESGQSLIDLVPEFEKLIGRQLPLASISAQEARHRFTSVIIAVFKVLCRAEHPLVLFLDDWQWADSASMHLLSRLQVSTVLNYVLIVAAYRQDEVYAEHPWVITMDDLRHQGVLIRDIRLSDLQPDELSLLVAADSNCDASESESLAASIHEKTNGNPFFSLALLRLIRNRGLSTEGTSGYREIADSLELPADVVEVFRERIRALTPSCQRLLAGAACLGNRFDLDSLAVTSELNRSECESALSVAGPELVTRVVAGGRANSEDAESEVWYQFSHDRVQQAAYSLISSEDLPGVRVEVARKLLDWMSPEQLSERVCEIAEHLNAGQELLREPAELIRGFELQLLAARKARAAIAYRSALVYHRAARRLLEHSDFETLIWRDHHDLGIALLREQAETEFLEGDREEAERCLRQAADRGTNAIEKAETLGRLIVQYTLLADYDSAIATGREALGFLGISLPESDFEVARDTEIRRTKEKISERSEEELATAEVCDDTWACTAAKILITMGPPCYRSHQQLWSVIVPKAVNLALDYGYLPEIGYSYTALAGLLGWGSNDYELARKLGRAAELAMQLQPVAPADKTVFYLMVGSSARHWFDHLARSSEDYMEAFRIGSQFGNLQYAAYAFGHNMYCRFYQGIPLKQLIPETESSLAFSKTRHNQWAIDLLTGGLFLFRALGEVKQVPARQGAWESKYFSDLSAHNNSQVACIFKVMKTTQLLLLGEFREAYQLSEEALELIPMVGTQGLLPWSEHQFSRLLILAALFETASSEQQKVWREELKGLLGQLGVWRLHGPENYQHKYDLACAEIARLENRCVEAAERYDRAIDGALEGGFIQWAGYANERASELWKRLGEAGLQQTYWQQAFEYADQWGATTKKLRLLEQRRNSLLDSVANSANGERGIDISQGLERLVARQLDLSQRQAEIVSKYRDYVVTQEKAAELAHAADSLRADIAERRKLTHELRKEVDTQAGLNEHLERRVQERTVELKRAEQRFRSVLESAPIPMLMTDPGGKFVLLNIAAESVFGYPRAELIGREFKLVIAERCYDQLPGPESSVGVGDQGPRLGAEKDLFAVRRDGREFPIEIGVGSVKMQEGDCLLLAVVDISTRKDMEQGLRRANEALEKSNVDLQQFAYVASHDLQTPLRGIAGFARFLEEDYGERLDAQGRDYVERIVEGAKRMNLLVNDLLDFSRVDSKAVSFAPTDLNEVLADLRQLLDASIEETNASITCESLPTVVVDRGQITQLLQNLVGNSIKYKKADEAPQIHVTARRDEASWVVCVEDNGIGIPDRHQEKVFEIFRRLHSEKTIPGTGIGLAVCRRIISRHGGDIWVESTEGQGSAFYFTIPDAW